MASVAAVAGGLAGRVPATARARVGEQLLVAGGQLAAGAGNLLFILLVARILEPPAFALLAAFLALFLLLQLFSESISSGSALVPTLGRVGRRRVVGFGALGGIVLALGALPLSTVLGVPLIMLLALAITAPIAAVLALERGRLYGERRHGRLVASLVAEPAVRIAIGLTLAAGYGAEAAAGAVVIGAAVALLVAASSRAAALEPARGSVGDAGWPRPMLVAFILFAAIQTQGVALANGLLPPEEAARFAAVATLGGIAAFATATIPLVLLPRAASGDRHATPIAVALAAGIGGLAVLATMAAPGLLVETVLGDRYSSVAELAAPYMFAMALLGVVRVLAAHACAVGRGPLVVRLVAAAAVAQLAMLIWLDTSAGGLVAATLISLAGLTIALGGQMALPRANAGGLAVAASLTRARSTVLALGAITAGGLVVRLLLNRGLWVDEAISVAQAQMSLGDMLEEIRTTDVHPPLHHLVLWATVRIAGSGELAVRAPSLVLGTLVIPMLFVLGRELYGRRVGLIAAACGALAPLLIWYSQEARMYALLTLLSVTAVWLQVRALREGRLVDWLALGLTMAAMFWTHYLAGGVQVLVQGAVAVVALAYAWRCGRRMRPLLVGAACAAAVLAIVVAPLVPFAMDQLRANEVAVERGAAELRTPAQAGTVMEGESAHPTVYSLITNIVWALWGYHADGAMLALGALWPLAVLLALALLGRGAARSSAIPLAVVAGTLAVIFAIGFVRPSLLEIRYAIGIVPLLVLLAARALDRLLPGPRALGVGAAVLGLTLVVGLADQQLNRSNPRQFDFAGVLEDVSAEAVPGDTIAFQPAWMEDVIDYYAPTVPARPLSAGLPRPDGRSRVFLTVVDIGPGEQRLDTAARVAEARERLDRDRRLVGRIEGTQVTTWVYR